MPVGHDQWQPDRIAQRRSVRLCRPPERRIAHGVQLGYGLWIVNLHASAHHPDHARRELALAAQHAFQWSQQLPLVLGGDFNVRDPQVQGMQRVASSDVDHVLVGARLRVLEPARILERGTLSDHVPLSVSLELSER